MRECVIYLAHRHRIDIDPTQKLTTSIGGCLLLYLGSRWNITYANRLLWVILQSFWAKYHYAFHVRNDQDIAVIAFDVWSFVWYDTHLSTRKLNTYTFSKDTGYIALCVGKYHLASSFPYKYTTAFLAKITRYSSCDSAIPQCIILFKRTS